jgi:hypothetical protein
MLVIEEGGKVSWTRQDAKATKFRSKEEILQTLQRIGLMLENYGIVDVSD